MKIKLVLTDDYRAQRRELSASAKIALYFVERAIRSNPDDPPGFGYQKYQIPELGDIVVTVVENGGLLVGYHRIEPPTISMDMVLDRRHAPDWYSHK